MDLTRETQRLFASQGDKTIYFNLVNMLVNLPTFANLYGECFFSTHVYWTYVGTYPNCKMILLPKIFCYNIS